MIQVIHVNLVTPPDTMRPPRVAFVCCDPGVPIFGTKGCSIHAQEILRGFVRRGWAADLVTLRPGGTPASDLAGVRVLPLPAIPGSDDARRESALQATNAAVTRLLEAAGPYDLVYERHALFSHAALTFAADRRIPGVLEVNAPLVDEQARHRALLDRAGAETSARRAFDAATTLVAVSREVADYLRTRTDRPDRIHVIPNGVDPARFPETSPEPTEVSHPFTVGFVGTLKPWHGLDILAEAFALVHGRVPRARLLIVGDGPEHDPTERRLARLGVGHACTFAGAVPPDAIPGLLASIDVAAAPYPALGSFYFSPLKIYEYMAARRAIVASDIGQIGSLVEHGVHGLLCPPGDPGALATAILRFHDDPDLRRRLGLSARETILANHTWDQVVSRTLAAAGLALPLAVAA